MSDDSATDADAVSLALSSEIPPIDTARVLDDLRRLAEATSDDRGAQRVAWTGTWAEARAFVVAAADELGLGVERDEAGNQWFYLPGERSETIAIGSHIDSVPNGGWLDGALGVMAAIGVARALVEAGVKPELTVAVVDFADEEGARFGRSLFGSAAAAGSLEPAELHGLRDTDGIGIEQALAEHGVDLDSAPDAASRLEQVRAFVELHIEQGPVLEAAGLGVGAVEGAMGISRSRVRMLGQIGHAGATPMAERRDPMVATASAITEIAARAEAVGGLATIGEVRVDPNVPTAVPREVEFIVDLRHTEAARLSELAAELAGVAERAAESAGCRCELSRIWESDPVRFDQGLIDIAKREASRVAGGSVPLFSGPGHDAVEMARAVPAAMLFAPSIDGISHAAEEDTDESDLREAIEAYGAMCLRLATGRASLGPDG